MRQKQSTKKKYQHINYNIQNDLDVLRPIKESKVSCEPLNLHFNVYNNLVTILFVEEEKRALGKIYDVFGQITDPYYCVRFNSPEHIRKCNIEVGMTVYYSLNTKHISLVFLDRLLK